MTQPKRTAPALLVGSALMLAACSGGGSSTVRGDLVGQRLDVAEHELDRGGIGYDAVGGGSLGIIVKSN